MSPQSVRLEPDGDAPLEPNPKVQRALIFVVALLGLLIVAGLVAVVARVIYLSSRPAAQPSAAPSQVLSTPPGAAGIAELPVPLPVGAAMKSVSMSGDRLAVHYEGPDGAGIIIVDLASKAIIARLPVGRDYLRIPPASER